MKLVTISSGSSGNSTYIESDRSKILVDVGLTGKMTIELMLSVGLRPEDLDAIFVSHEHSDHIKGVGVMSRKFDLPIFANEKTWLAMQSKIGAVDPKNINVFKSNTFFSYRDMDIHTMSTFHDAADPVFFSFYQKSQKISILTDTGHVSNLMIDAVRDSDILILESNHDGNMLETGPYPNELKKRIGSDHGHLSNGKAGEVMGKIIQAKGEKIILGHLSTTNNRPDIALKNMEDLLENKGVKVGKDMELEVASEFKAGKLIDLGGNYR